MILCISGREAVSNPVYCYLPQLIKIGSRVKIMVLDVDLFDGFVIFHFVWRSIPARVAKSSTGPNSIDVEENGDAPPRPYRRALTLSTAK